MEQKVRRLTSDNISGILSEFQTSIALLGSSIAGKTGVDLFESLKREKLETGPYPRVTLFEAANRIMSDLVILHGVGWLLKNKTFPFDSYVVEFGNEDKNGFDVTAEGSGATLVGEAFNVAPSFFRSKKLFAINKLRRNGLRADYRILLVNHDAAHDAYVPKDDTNIHFFAVDIRSGAVRSAPRP